jgi:probable O-glycosylation ligase (exosortase A-associated)
VKQTLFVAALTLIGMLGALGAEPFVGVAVYYFFAVLRPQFIWAWALPEGYGWSGYVAWTTLFATILAALSGRFGTTGEQKYSATHKLFFLFGAWICLTYVTSQNKEVAWFWFLEYLKIFIMFGAAGLVIHRVQQIWWIYLAATVALIYIAYEMNFLYFTAGRLDIYHNGYGGLDNNGAALMLAMGVPLAMFAWEGATGMWRWGFAGAIPLLLHAVLMSYSRGAMVSLLVVTPLLILRSGRKKTFAVLLLLVLAMVPFLAGNEIRARFFTVSNYEEDGSAQSRFDSWRAAIRIANDYPIFGVGIRNSNLLSFQYGADTEGRTIHSQYLQTLADSGYVGLLLYLMAMGSGWVAIIRTRRHLKEEVGAEVALARSMLNGLEGALVVFGFGSLFLSLEVFELPYLCSLLAAQTSLLLRVRSPKAHEPAWQSNSGINPGFRPLRDQRT